MYDSSLLPANGTMLMIGNDPVTIMVHHLTESFGFCAKWGWSLETVRKIHRIEAEYVASLVPPERWPEYIKLRAGESKLSIPHTLECMGIVQ